MRLGLTISEALNGLRRNVSMVISVVLVTFVSLTFVGAAILAQMQVAKLHGFWEDRAQVAVYMCSSSEIGKNCVDGSATPEEVAAVKDALQGPTLGPLIANYTFTSQADAYKSMKANGNDADGLLTEDQANAVFRINLKDQGNTTVISEAFRGTKGVQQVADAMKYLEPVFQILTVTTYVAVGLAALMLIAAVLLIATTIRLSAYARRKEIGIMRLVGASNGVIQTPFILEGVFAAFIGTLLSSGAVVALVHFGVNGYLRPMDSITPWVTMADAFVVVPIIIIVGVVLAALSAGFAIRRWLRA